MGGSGWQGLDSQLADHERWLGLSDKQIGQLEAQGNRAEDWSKVLVSSRFDPSAVWHNLFLGHVTIGALDAKVLQSDGPQLKVGISYSTIADCIIGDNVAIHHCHYLARYKVDDKASLFDVGQAVTTSAPRFGNGIDPQTGNPAWLDVANEAGGRGVVAFDQMIPADAYIWARYRQDQRLQDRLLEITKAVYKSTGDCLGWIGQGCLVQNARILKNIRLGPYAVVDGADRLEELTVLSSQAEPTRIGTAVILVDGIVGLGCRVDRASQAHRFVLCNNCTLDHGACISHTVLGDNSTVECCEIRNSLIFPNHNQHHKSSFLIASCILGQSNIAAGATIGSNHNSRLNDGELLAGRGFWPGLCTSVRFPSRFASFVLLAPGQYKAEMDIPLPFCLVSLDCRADRLELLPAYWWLYNMYALVRNAWKYQQRDKRKTKTQYIETNYLAPDTIEQIRNARRMMEVWVGRAYLGQDKDTDELAATGRRILTNQMQTPAGLEVLADGLYKSRNKAKISRPFEAYHAYGQMLLYYAICTLLDHWQGHKINSIEQLTEGLSGRAEHIWVNLGGQLVPQSQVEELCQQIGAGRLNTWAEIHQQYERFLAEYPIAKARHAWTILCEHLGTDWPTSMQLERAIDQSIAIFQYVNEQVVVTRRKDLDDPFRKALYSNQQEMEAVLVRPEDDPVVQFTATQTGRALELARQFKQLIQGS